MNAGDKLGPYTILALAGKGGMGEVYRAHDDRLRRDVAIKVSNSQFTERFTREARTIASLNHTNIAHLYDVGPNYLVMEYVDGADLKGPLDFDEALPIIQQLVDGIEAAHEKNIIHRDLKPANIKITPEGVVKILDFGLAKAMEPPADIDPENSPTLTMGGTVAGTILGTAAYMSPEQAKGKQADKRSDIWSFGVVLYELLTGRRMFAGETMAETLASVMKEQLTFDDLPADTPPALRKLVKRCLERDLKRRVQSMGEARIAIEDILSGAAADDVKVVTQQAPTKPAWIPWAAAALFAVSTIAALMAWAPWRTQPPKPLVRFEVDIGKGLILREDPNFSLATSPDGTRLAYLASDGKGPVRIYTRRLDQPQPTALPGTEGATFPMFSPDSQWIGFLTNSKLNKISVEGGAVVPIADTPPIVSAASWAENGDFFLGQLGTGGLLRVPAAGGKPVPLTDLGQDVAHASPFALPGGKAVLFNPFTTLGGVISASIEVVTLADGGNKGVDRKTIVPGGTQPLYLPSGHLAYLNKGTLFAVPFDPERLETRGTAVPILADVNYNTGNLAASLSFSGNGTFVYRAGAPGAVSTGSNVIDWIDSSARRTPLLAKSGNYSEVSLSPDGKRLAFLGQEGTGWDLLVHDLQLGTTTRLTFTGNMTTAIWSPDGRFIFFGTLNGMFVTRADGSTQPQQLPLPGQTIVVPWSMPLKGDRLAYMTIGTGAADLYTLPLEESGGQWKAGKPEPFLATRFAERVPAFSPDGRWIAYESNESGTFEVYVRPFPSNAQGGKWPISSGGGERPRWSPARQELLYRSGDRIMAMPYTVNGDAFVPQKPRVYADKLPPGAWDIAPDGRIAIVAPAASSQAAPEAPPPVPDHTIIVLQNFFDELKRKAPIP